MSSSSSPSIESQVFTMAASNDVAGLQALFDSKNYGSNWTINKQFCADMALMGATSSEDSIQKLAAAWALKNGACELWGIQQKPSIWADAKPGQDKNKKLCMLGGAGEVSKGTFKHMHICEMTRDEAILMLKKLMVDKKMCAQHAREQRKYARLCHDKYMLAMTLEEKECTKKVWLDASRDSAKAKSSKSKSSGDADSFAWEHNLQFWRLCEARDKRHAKRLA